MAQYKDYRWTQWCIIFATLFAYLLAFFTNETYGPAILQQKANRLGRPAPSVPKEESILRRLGLRYGRPLYMLFTEAPVFFFSLYTAFTFSILFSLFAAFPYIFSRAPYSFTVSQSGLAFVAVGVGVLVSAATNILIDRIVYQAHHRKAIAAGQTRVDPEHRLYGAMGGAFGVTIGLFWFGWCADKGVHWAVTLLGSIPFAWGNLGIFVS